MKASLIILILLTLLPSPTSSCDETVCGVGGTCTGTPTPCTTCGTLSGLQSYLYPTDTQCYVNCPANSYKDINGGTCTLCDGTCNGCSGSSTACKQCASSHFRVIGSSLCTTDCGGGFYGDKNTIQCTACPSGCSGCSMPTSTVECSACSSVAGTQYYLSSTSCVSICPSGEYGSTSGSPSCQSCTAPCATCSGSATTCLTCSTGVLEFGTNNCPATCPSGQYDAGSSKCALCDSNCLTCSTDAVTCDTCGIEAGQQTYLHTDFKCYATCPHGNFGEVDGSGAYVCSPCDSSCDGCSITSTNCINCASSSYFRKIGSNECTNDCGTGYYGATATGLCTVCPIGCTACSLGTEVTCSACQAVAGVNYYLNDGKYCVSACPLTAGGAGQYGSLTGSPSCASCHTSCQTCSGGNNNNCITCVSGKFLAFGLGTCLDACPDGQYAPSSSQTCLSCNVNCKTCSGSSTHCDSCSLSVNGVTLYLLSTSNACLANCPTQKFGNASTNVCDPCHSSCYTCDGPLDTDCLSCSSGNLNVSSSKCVASCGDGKYSSNNVCYSCASYCKTCTSGTVCTACQEVNGVPYYLN